VAIGLEGALSPIQTTAPRICRLTWYSSPANCSTLCLIRGWPTRLPSRPSITCAPHEDSAIRRDLGFVISELKKTLVGGRDQQAEQGISQAYRRWPGYTFAYRRLRRHAIPSVSAPTPPANCVLPDTLGLAFRAAAFDKAKSCNAIFDKPCEMPVGLLASRPRHELSF